MSVRALHVVRPPLPIPFPFQEQVVFCSHCGRRPDSDLESRICPRCELGLLLEAGARLVPTEGEPFLVTDEELVIRAMSQDAERLLGVLEPAVIHRPLSQLLVGLQLDPEGVPLLPRQLRAAAEGRKDVVDVVVGRPNHDTDPWSARLGACGPPGGALLVLEYPE